MVEIGLFLILGELSGHLMQIFPLAGKDLSGGIFSGGKKLHFHIYGISSRLLLDDLNGPSKSSVIQLAAVGGGGGRLLSLLSGSGFESWHHPQ